MSRLNLYWWSKINFGKGDYENYGDLLSKYLAEKISGKKVKWYNTKKKRLINKKHYLSIGSIISHANKYSVIWGSGIISQEDVAVDAEYISVRGPKTRDYLLQFGLNVPAIYGDPAILLPRYYNPEISKIYNTSIIPHYVDLQEVNNNLSDTSTNIINLLTNDIELTTDEILSSKRIISSSLHGVIVAHTYGIPALWVKLSDKLSGDDIKFYDYFESVGLNVKTCLKLLPEELTAEKIDSLFIHYADISLPNKDIINKLSDKLLSVCPFNND